MRSIMYSFSTIIITFLFGVFVGAFGIVLIALNRAINSEE
jgi:hypothetical protein